MQNSGNTLSAVGEKVEQAFNRARLLNAGKFKMSLPNTSQKTTAQQTVTKSLKQKQ